MKMPQEEFDKVLITLIQKGISNTDLSMFDEETKIKLATKAAEEFFAGKNYAETVIAYRFIGDTEKLNKMGDSFLKSGLLNNALYSYKAANNETMVKFIKQNFNEEDYTEKIYM